MANEQYEEFTGYLPTGNAINLDTQSIIDEIETWGDTVTLIEVTDNSYSKWGDPTEGTEETHNLISFCQILSQENQLVKDGIFQSGDKLFWFKGSQTGLSRGNRITHLSKDYEIVETIEHSVGDTIYITECRTKKV